MFNFVLLIYMGARNIEFYTVVIKKVDNFSIIFLFLKLLIAKFLNFDNCCLHFHNSLV